ncbi:hypothetical protein BGZ94_002838 [Podila epigama]|nr:hypothetical protein BGZ94_002838 [Podila epigama]
MPVDVVDILGQQPLLNLYTQLTLCYSIPDPTLHTAVSQTLQKGLDRLFTSFPWLAGLVEVHGASPGNTGTARIVLGKDETEPRLVITDLSGDHTMPTMETLRSTRFPMSMLDENMLAPRRTLPGNPSEPTTRPAFLIQATFIQGGLLLTFVGHHQVMDMMGQGEVIALFDKACRNEPFTAKELELGNLSREHTIPFLEGELNMPTLQHQVSDVKPAPPNAPSKWAYFSFEPASLAAMKASTTSAVPSGFVSTDDVLSSFIWQAVMRARAPRLRPDVKATYTRAVDVRAALGISPKYTGVVQTLAYHSYTLKTLLEEPLGAVAAHLRAKLDPNMLAHDTRAFATLLHRSPDKMNISFTTSLDLSVDLMISSWCKVECSKLDFGLGLGRPESVRRPRFDPFESLIYLLPKAVNGEISAAICLRDEDMERFKADPEVTKYAIYIG